GAVTMSTFFAYTSVFRSLADGGNAALALNLAGTQPRVVWFAPQQPPAESTGDAALSDLIPEHVGWIVWQLIVVVVLLAWWQGRRDRKSTRLNSSHVKISY